MTDIVGNETFQEESTDLEITEDTLKRRAAIFEAEEELKSQVDNHLGIMTAHHFGGGCCSREMFVPAGTMFVGKIHRYEYLNLLMKGTAIVFTEDGKREITGPFTWVGRSGTKVSAYAVTDLVWSNVFRADTTSVKDLESQEIVETYEELEEEWESGVTPKPSKLPEVIPFKDEDGSWVISDHLKITVEGLDSNNISEVVEKSLLEK